MQDEERAAVADANRWLDNAEAVKGFVKTKFASIPIAKFAANYGFEEDGEYLEAVAPKKKARLA